MICFDITGKRVNIDFEKAKGHFNLLFLCAKHKNGFLLPATIACLVSCLAWNLHTLPSFSFLNQSDTSSSLLKVHLSCSSGCWWDFELFQLSVNHLHHQHEENFMRRLFVILILTFDAHDTNTICKSQWELLEKCLNLFVYVDGSFQSFFHSHIILFHVVMLVNFPQLL